MLTQKVPEVVQSPEMLTKGCDNKIPQTGAQEARMSLSVLKAAGSWWVTPQVWEDLVPVQSAPGCSVRGGGSNEIPLMFY